MAAAPSRQRSDAELRHDATEDAAGDASLFTEIAADVHATQGVAQQQTASHAWYLDYLPGVFARNGRIDAREPTRNTHDVFVLTNTAIGAPAHVEANSFLAGLSPLDAAMRRQPYEHPVYNDILHVRLELATGAFVSAVLTERVLCGFVPAMVGAPMCRTRTGDARGDARQPVPCSFVCDNGVPKMMTPIITMAMNRVIVTTPPKPRYALGATIRPRERGRARSTSTFTVYLVRYTNRLVAVLPFTGGVEMPISALMRALGARSLEEAVLAISSGGMLLSGSSAFSKSAAVDASVHELVTHQLRGEAGQRMRTASVGTSLMPAERTAGGRRRRNYVCPNFWAGSPDDALEWIGSCIPSYATDAARAALDAVGVEDVLLDAPVTASAVRVDAAARAAYIVSARGLLIAELFPHVGTLPLRATRTAKMGALGHMVWRLMRVKLGAAPVDALDDYAFKALETPGFKLLVRTTHAVRAMTRNVERAVSKAVAEGLPLNVPRIFLEAGLTTPLRKAMSTGVFTMDRGAQEGAVTHTITEQSALANANDATRLDKALTKSTSQTKPRGVVWSQWNYVCPVSTTEGDGAGIVNHAALLATVTMGSRIGSMWPLLLAAGGRAMRSAVPGRWGAAPDAPPGAFVPTGGVTYTSNGKPLTWALPDDADVADATIAALATPDTVTILVNGVALGTLLWGAADVARTARDLRRRGGAPAHMSVALDRVARTLELSNIHGEFRRPVLVTEELGFRGSVDAAAAIMRDAAAGPAGRVRALFAAGLLEYISPNEERGLLVRADPLVNAFAARLLHPPPYTHSTLLGACSMSLGALAAPAPHCTQPARVTYSFCLGKGAQAVAAEPPPRTSSMALAGGEVPAVGTIAGRILDMAMQPMGLNVPAAEYASSGNNQEDSATLSVLARDLCVFETLLHRSYVEDALSTRTRHGVPAQAFCRPELTTRGRKRACYDRIDESGFPAPGQLVRSEEVIIGKVAATRDGDGVGLRDKSLVAPPGHEPHVVVHAMRTRRTRAREIGVVLTRASRDVARGDKFSTRSGQKCTVSVCESLGDAGVLGGGPDVAGIVPVFTRNPHGYSRMACGNDITERTSSLLAAARGAPMDATVFLTAPAQDAVAALTAAGSSVADGTALLFSGATGAPLECGRVQFTMSYIMRLRQMARDFLTGSGADAAVNPQTRQSMQGRGGMRLGNMELAILIAAGGQWLLQEELRASDRIDTCFCATCGLLCGIARAGAPGARATEQVTPPCCAVCGPAARIVNKEFQWSTLTLFSYLMTAGIAPRLRVADVPSGDAVDGELAPGVGVCNDPALLPRVFKRPRLENTEGGAPSDDAYAVFLAGWGPAV